MKIFSLKPSRLNIVTLIVALGLTISSYIGEIPSAFAQTFQPPQMIASLFSFSGNRPKNLGVEEGKFANCPDSPNCVSSQSIDVVHQIDPLNYADQSPTEAFEKLKTIIKNMDNAKIITETESYLYAEFTSALMGFVDDVEFSLDKPEQIIHVRSASRLGESDLGVNRNRIEMIRSVFES
ncbi:DUF1499 domain-containing protein [Limnoraphis robusta Tam1]|uniref:DUF1499 domain-containing protein n=1 Tax=Limnoraphis robusta TaxID=1118279 RepID=UPI002B21C57D|nr:DUF1499 domain-containing protein [Limnoraphis robusta]MEA5539945.1 DUF1499 domain-containing protein [Limnoraphis robusta Tam1]